MFGTFYFTGIMSEKPKGNIVGLSTIIFFGYSALQYVNSIFHILKKAHNIVSLKSVGTTRFELATPCTPCKCATGLRYVPNNGAANVRLNR